MTTSFLEESIALLPPITLRTFADACCRYYQLQLTSLSFPKIERTMGIAMTSFIEISACEKEGFLSLLEQADDAIHELGLALSTGELLTIADAAYRITKPYTAMRALVIG
ncbi:hypothetical protein [Paracoccus aminophilus]|uniref:hypothetical protein n=1 Tax=Paracoccus aminophilus TaxID=34003 RepID=UPI0011DE4995|nr:hypothetical protein [Paracoccus aminophilus]